MMAEDTPESLDKQIKYVTHLNLNSIRLEGFWGKDHTLYDLCDRYGILMLVGWSCHWEHAQYLGKPVDSRFGGVVSEADVELVSRMWQDQVLWLRHHASIFVWVVASDKVPKKELELKYLETFEKYDHTRPYLNSTGGIGSEQGIITDSVIISEVSGSSRVKMLGPYAYTPPVYWFTDKNLGGAYGFNTETGPGVQVPHLDSIKKFIPEEQLWPIDEAWNFHCGLNEFSHLDRFRSAMRERHGEPHSLQDFALKAQAMNYELMRPMFEAFQCNKGSATGVVQWMLNAAWPKMYWQLYDWYLMPNAAFYATRKACEPLHLLYNYGHQAIYCVNDHAYPVEALQARIRILDNRSKIYRDEAITFDSPADSSMQIFSMPDLTYSNVYFLDLRLLVPDRGEVGVNFYWLSTRPDVLDYDLKLEPWPYHTPTRQQADYTLLNQLPKTEVIVRKVELHGTSGAAPYVDITVHNPGEHIAFLVEFNLVDPVTGEICLPVFWQDNYVSLLPGEARTIQCGVGMDLASAKSILTVSGWNIENLQVEL
jgi:exo-1,4-beta-D-glucosaminidase